MAELLEYLARRLVDGVTDLKAQITRPPRVTIGKYGANPGSTKVSVHVESSTTTGHALPIDSGLTVPERL